MLQKRFDRTEENEGNGSGAGTAMALGEAARSSAQPPQKSPEGAGDEKMSLFWRVFGGTILSMVTLAAITLYNGISSNISELRNELNREREARAELVKKDEFNSRTSSQYERIRSFEGLKAEHEGFKERVSANTAAVEALKKDAAATLDAIKKEVAAGADAARKDAAALEILKDRTIALEAVRKEVAGLEVLKEKLTNASADVKAARDDVMKIQQELERNRAFDLERKANRDVQHKQTEEALKELQKGLQDCREKLARLEGMQPAGQPRGAFFPFETPAKPTAPAETKGAGNPAGAGDGKPGPNGEN